MKNQVTDERKYLKIVYLTKCHFNGTLKYTEYEKEYVKGQTKQTKNISWNERHEHDYAEVTNSIFLR